MHGKISRKRKVQQKKSRFLTRYRSLFLSFLLSSSDFDFQIRYIRKPVKVIVIFFRTKTVSSELAKFHIFWINSMPVVKIDIIWNFYSFFPLIGLFRPTLRLILLDSDNTDTNSKLCCLWYFVQIYKFIYVIRNKISKLRRSCKAYFDR